MSPRRGNVTMVVTVFGTLLGFSALSVDVGLIRVAGTEVQAVMDAASLSAVSVLDGTEAGIVRAREVAVQIASQNKVLGLDVVLTLSDVVVGTWDRETGTFVPYAPGDDPDPVNAVRVMHQPPEFDSGLGGVAFGVMGYTVRARSMAVRPPGGPAASAECFLPLAIPDCHLASAPLGANPPPMKFTFAPTPTDSIAWGNPTANPNTSWIIDQLEDNCGSAPLEIGDPVHVNEGVHNSGIAHIAGMINGTELNDNTVWDPIYGPLPPRDGVSANTTTDSAITNASRWGYTVEGPVALVNGGADCAAVSFTADMPTTGIGWAVIYDVQDNAGGQNLWIQLDVVGDHEIWGEEDETGTAAGPGNVTAKKDPALELW